MYSQEAIDVLINRIGWSDLTSDLPIVLSDENKTATSEKTFDFYHSLVQVDNLYSSVPKVNMIESEFNTYLSEFRNKAVHSALTSILDNHSDYDVTKDYSSIIMQRPMIFDDVIGYSVAIKTIELLISTNRKNAEERNASMSYNTLKVELYGAKNSNGYYVAKGLDYELKNSIKKAQKIIFPFTVLVKNGNCQ